MIKGGSTTEKVERLVALMMADRQLDMQPAKSKDEAKTLSDRRAKNNLEAVQIITDLAGQALDDLHTIAEAARVMAERTPRA